MDFSNLVIYIVINETNVILNFCFTRIPDFSIADNFPFWGTEPLLLLMFHWNKHLLTPQKWTAKHKVTNSHFWSLLSYKKVLFAAVKQLAGPDPFLVSRLFDNPLIQQNLHAHKCKLLCSMQTTEVSKTHDITSGKHTGKCHLPLLSLPFMMFLQNNAAQNKTNCTQWWQKDLRSRSECLWHGKTPPLIAHLMALGDKIRPHLCPFSRFWSRNPTQLRSLSPSFLFQGNCNLLKWVWSQKTTEQKLHCKRQWLPKAVTCDTITINIYHSKIPQILLE